MRRAIVALALAVSLSACATTSGRTVATSVARADAAYARARPYVELMLPYLPADRAARVRLAMAIVERALLAARVATTAAAQAAALKEAQSALAVVEASAAL